MKNLKTLLFFLLLLLANIINAQTVDLSLRFNAKTSSYEVYAKPNFTKGEFLIGAGSQVTVLMPSDVADVSLKANSLATGKWIDIQPVLRPKAYPKRDFHTFVSQGGVINFEKEQSTLLFSFQLPYNFDHKGVRLFVNSRDAKLNNDSAIKKLGNYIANDLTLTDFYQKNYDISKDVTGKLKDWRGYPIEGASVELGNQTLTTLYDGRFEFYNTLMSDAATIHFHKDIDSQEGVNISDLIRLHQHLSGEKPFDKPFQWIASDLDNSGTITIDDVLILKQLLNEPSPSLGWRIIPAPYYQSLPTYQIQLPNSTTILDAERTIEIDFVAIKLGDINGSYTLKESIPNNISPSSKTLTINLLNENLEAGENYVIPFSTNDFSELSAYQATLKIENAAIVHLENTFKKQPGLTLKQLSEDLVIASWINDGLRKMVSGRTDDFIESHQSETAILELEIVPQKDGLLSDFITVLKEPVKTEAYDKDGKVMSLQLMFRSAPKEEGTTKVYQNRPNPFRGTTSISYLLPKKCKTKLTLTDESGKVIKVYEGMGKKGFNAFSLQGNDLPKGLIYYTVETEFGKDTKKMLHLN